jgi:hypothetical protein
MRGGFSSKPPGNNRLNPRWESRSVEAAAATLGGVLVVAEELLAAALREDEEWLRRTRRCT